MKTLFFSFVILCIPSFGFSNTEACQILSCDAPTSLYITTQSHNSISFDWDDCGNSFTEYQIFYIKNGQTSPIYSCSKSEISFSGLSGGVYQFHFYTVCGGTVSSIIIEDIMIG